MAETQTLARPYAKAVFELAREAGQFKAWSDRLSGLAAIVATPEVAALVSHPSVGRSQLVQLIVDAARGGLGESGQALVELLAGNGRLALAGAIAAQFEALRAEAEARVEVEIRTATAVDAAQQQALSSAIARRLGRQVDVRWQQDESLVAGAVIRAGDLIIDGSVSGELAKLARSVAV